MEAKPVDSIALESGLVLDLFEESRPMGADRWIVSFTARMDVEVKPEYFEDLLTSDAFLENVRALVGSRVTYQHKKERHFVLEAQKDELFKGLKERFLRTNLAYLSSPDFPRRLILKEYQDALEGVLGGRRQ